MKETITLEKLPFEDLLIGDKFFASNNKNLRTKFIKISHSFNNHLPMKNGGGFNCIDLDSGDSYFCERREFCERETLSKQKEITLIFWRTDRGYDAYDADDVMDSYNGKGREVDYSEISLSDTDHRALRCIDTVLEESTSEMQCILLRQCEGSVFHEIASKFGAWSMPSLEALFERAKPISNTVEEVN